MLVAELIFLFLQAVFASFFSLAIKWVNNRKQDGHEEDIFVIGPINYIVAGLVSLPMFLTVPTFELSDPNFQGALLTGGVMGAIYFVAFFFVIYCVRWVGVSSTTVVAVLSILMPIVFAAFYWNDRPDGYQVIGIVIALIALTLIGGKQSDVNLDRRWLAPLVLLAFFLLCGFSRIAQEAFKHVSIESQKPAFTTAAFLVASVPSLIWLVYSVAIKKQKIRGTEIAVGVAMGLANIAQTFLVLKCFEYYSGFIVFPVTSAGAIVITTLAATLALKERLNVRTWAGIGLAVVALFLLNWWSN